MPGTEKRDRSGVVEKITLYMCSCINVSKRYVSDTNNKSTFMDWSIFQSIYRHMTLISLL